MNDDAYDVIIAGSGPAGLTAAFYGQRLGLRTIVFGDIPGGNLYMIERLTNMPGFPEGIPGMQLGTLLFQQAQQEGAVLPLVRIERIFQQDGFFNADDVNGGTHRARSAVLATGRVPKTLDVPNAHLKGIHFCSICDGPLYRGKHATLAVVGSDNAAGQHALTLSRIADQVLLIQHGQASEMDAAHRRQVAAQENIRVIEGQTVAGFTGLDMLEAVVLQDATGARREIAADGVFMAIGWRPNTGLLQLRSDTDSEGYVETDTALMSSIDGLFAAGDVRAAGMHQVLTACAEGARAIKSAEEYLKRRTAAPV